MLVFMALGGVAQALSVDIPTVLQGKKGGVRADRRAFPEDRGQ